MAEIIRHPLEPLTAAEVKQAVEILQAQGKVTATTRFVSISLKEPPKQAVHGFSGHGGNGRPAAPREAFVVLFLKKHYGVDNTSLVMVDIWSAGNYGTEEDRTRRLARPLCFLRSDPTDNGYARPLEGVRPVVDLNTMAVIRVEEHGHWPLPPEESNYAAVVVAGRAHPEGLAHH